MMRSTADQLASMFNSQLYVDDPTITVTGSPATVQQTLDSVPLWWLVLGLPLAWKKGMVYDKYEVHTWVSVTFQVMEDNTVLWAYHKDTWLTRPKMLKPLESGVGS